MPLIYILRKYTKCYKFNKKRKERTTSTNMQKKKKKKELETLIETITIYRQDIGTEFDIEK